MIDKGLIQKRRSFIFCPGNKPRIVAKGVKFLDLTWFV